MALAGFSHTTSPLQSVVHHGDFVSPDLFALMEEATSELRNMEFLLTNYSSSSLTATHHLLLPPNSAVSTTAGKARSLMYPDEVVSFPPSMLSFDHSNLLENDVYDDATLGHGTMAMMEEDRVAEEQLRWLYSGTGNPGATFHDDGGDGLLGAIHTKKRPYMPPMDDVVIQPYKRQCTGTGTIRHQKNVKDPQSLAAKNRRERISERLKNLQELVPNGTKVDLVTMLDKAFHYVKFLQLQVKVLANDEFWPANGGRTPQAGEVKEAMDAILASHRTSN